MKNILLLIFSLFIILAEAIDYGEKGNAPFMLKKTDDLNSWSKNHYKQVEVSYPCSQYESEDFSPDPKFNLYYRCQVYHIVTNHTLNTNGDKWTSKNDGWTVNKREKGEQISYMDIKLIVHTYADDISDGYYILVQENIDFLATEKNSILVDNNSEHVSFFTTKGGVKNIFFHPGEIEATHPPSMIGSHTETNSYSKRKDFGFELGLTVKEDNPDVNAKIHVGREKTRTKTDSIDIQDWKVEKKGVDNKSIWNIYLNYPFDTSVDTEKNFRSWVADACKGIKDWYVNDKYILKDIPISAKSSMTLSTQTLYRSTVNHETILRIEVEHGLGDIIVGSHFITHMRFKEIINSYWAHLMIFPPK